METVKCVLVGDPSVGKSWLITTYITNKNPEGYVPTLFNNFNKVVKVGEKRYNLTLWDTAGHDEYNKLRSLSLQETDVFLICYAVNNIVSFNNTRKWIEELSAYNVPMILCGTKCDVVDGELVDKALPQTFTRQYNLYGHVECSAVELINLKRVFTMAIEAYVNPQRYSRRRRWLMCCC
jgi:cell division control protein 42